jgi:glycosyltransferase involved in cell wall biosynthesis
VNGHALPTFDLVVATVARVEPLRELLASLEQQTYRGFRVLLADQNQDDRLDAVVAGHAGLPLLRLRAATGLSRARNVALDRVEADVVAFPDDDCTYPRDLLERVATVLATRPELDGVTGRTAGADGTTSDRWPPDVRRLTRDTVWHGGNSASSFLRSELVHRVGRFDETLGLGAGTTRSSGEDIDYIVRALATGAHVEYRPDLVIVHEPRSPDADALRLLGGRDGASVGYLLAKHGYPARTVARMLVRPLGGAALALVRGDGARRRFHLATLRGRLSGYREGRRP